MRDPAMEQVSPPDAGENAVFPAKTGLHRAITLLRDPNRLRRGAKRRLRRAGDRLLRPSWLWRRQLVRRAGSLSRRVSPARTRNGPLIATLIWARSFWESPDLRTSGAGRMPQDAFRCLQEVGFDTRFVGQDARRYPPEVIDSDLVVAHIPGLMRLPWRCLGTTLLYTANTHVSVKNRRLRDSARRWGLAYEGSLIDEWLYKTAYEVADYLLIAENDRGIQNFLDHGVSENKIRRYNNCVDGDIWVPNPEKRRRFSFVCYSSAHGLRKGMPALAAAWRKWYSGQDAELHLVGMPAPEFRTLFSMANNGEDIPGLVLELGRFPGQYRPIIELVGSCHVGVLPTLEDAQPGTLLEMASCGLPVITTIESGVDFSTDFCKYVEADNPDSIVEALEYWYQNRTVATDCGQLARNFVLAHHNWQIFRHRFKEIIWEVTDNGNAIT